METIYLIITGLSIIASILAWLAKLKWSKEYRIAKEAEILAVKEQLNILKEKNELFKELSSDKIMELYRSTKEGLEILNNNILKEKENLEIKIKELEVEIERLKRENENSIKLPDFSILKNMSFQIENSFRKFNENYSKQMIEISKSIEKIKDVDFAIKDNDATLFIEAKKKHKQ